MRDVCPVRGVHHGLARFLQSVRVHQLVFGFSQIVLIVLFFPIRHVRQKMRCVDDADVGVVHYIQIVVWLAGFVFFCVNEFRNGGQPVGAVVELVAPRVFLGDDARDAVKQLQNFGTADLVKHTAVDDQTRLLTPFLQGVVLHAPAPETGEPVDSLKVGALHDHNASKRVRESVVVLDHTVSGLVVKYFVKRNGIHVVENEGDVFVVFRIFVARHHEPDVLHSPAVEGACVVLVRKQHFVVVLVLQNKTHVFAKKVFVLRAIAVRYHKDFLGHEGHCRIQRVKFVHWMGWI